MITTAFTDPQGTTYTAAVLMIKSAHSNSNQSSSETLDITTGEYTSSSSDNENINYSVVYWADQASLDEGNLPYQLSSYSSEGMHELNFNSDSNYDGLDLVAKCEKHLVDNIIQA